MHFLDLGEECDEELFEVLCDLQPDSTRRFGKRHDISDVAGAGQNDGCPLQGSDAPTIPDLAVAEHVESDVVVKAETTLLVIIWVPESPIPPELDTDPLELLLAVLDTGVELVALLVHRRCTLAYLREHLF